MHGNLSMRESSLLESGATLVKKLLRFLHPRLSLTSCWILNSSHGRHGSPSPIDGHVLVCRGHERRMKPTNSFVSFISFGIAIRNNV